MKKITIFLILSGLILMVPGCKKTDSANPTPVVKDPYAMFKYTIKENGVVSFTNTSTDATSYLWNFGDGETSTTAVVTIEHKYLQNGTYKATLTAYGNGKSAGAYADFNISTAVGETVTDIDGNVYHTIKIGTQVWMIENLKTTKLNDGTLISLVTDNSAWGNLLTPGYCWYSNDISNKNTYGALYNGYTINTGKIAPQGWHVPTDAEWTVLTSYLGGEDIAGGKLKSTGTIEAGTGFWYSPNTGATNETGFSAVPAGLRDRSNGTFMSIGNYGSWWSSSASFTDSAWIRDMFYNGITVLRRTGYYNDGCSLRCIKD